MQGSVRIELLHHLRTLAHVNLSLRNTHTAAATALPREVEAVAKCRAGREHLLEDVRGCLARVVVEGLRLPR